MDFPCTQQLDLDETFVSNQDDDDCGEKKQIGKLVVNNQGKVKEYPILEGENIIGRHSDCGVCIENGIALSKQHACIEVVDEQVFVFDYGSRNKTRLGKMKLKPHVRYSIKHGDKIKFANIECTYNEVSAALDSTFDSHTNIKATWMKSAISTPLTSTATTTTLLAADTPETSFKKPLQQVDDDFVPDSQPINESILENSVLSMDKSFECKESLIRKENLNPNMNQLKDVITDYEVNNNKQSPIHCDITSDVDESVLSTDNSPQKSYKRNEKSEVSVDDDSDETDVEENVLIAQNVDGNSNPYLAETQVGAVEKESENTEDKECGNTEETQDSTNRSCHGNSDDIISSNITSNCENNDVLDSGDECSLLPSVERNSQVMGGQVHEDVGVDVDLKAVEDLDQVGEDVENLDQVGEDVEDLDQVGEDVEDLDQVGEDVEDLDQVGEDVEDQVGEDVEDLDQVGEDVEDLDQVGEDVKDQHQVGEDVEDLDQVGEDVEDLDQVGEDVEVLDQVGEDVEFLDQVGEDVEVLNQVGKDVEVLDQVGEEVEDLDQVGKDVEDLDQVGKDVEDLDQVGEDVEDLDQVGEDVEDLDQVEEKSISSSEIRNNNDEVSSVERNIEHIDTPPIDGATVKQPPHTNDGDLGWKQLNVATMKEGLQLNENIVDKVLDENKSEETSINEFLKEHGKSTADLTYSRNVETSTASPDPADSGDENISRLENNVDCDVTDNDASPALGDEHNADRNISELKTSSEINKTLIKNTQFQILEDSFVDFSPPSPENENETQDCRFTYTENIYANCSTQPYRDLGNGERDTIVGDVPSWDDVALSLPTETVAPMQLESTSTIATPANSTTILASTTTPPSTSRARRSRLRTSRHGLDDQGSATGCIDDPTTVDVKAMTTRSKNNRKTSNVENKKVTRPKRRRLNKKVEKPENTDETVSGTTGSDDGSEGTTSRRSKRKVGKNRAQIYPTPKQLIISISTLYYKLFQCDASSTRCNTVKREVTSPDKNIVQSESTISVKIENVENNENIRKSQRNGKKTSSNGNSPKPETRKRRSKQTSPPSDQSISSPAKRIKSESNVQLSLRPRRIKPKVMFTGVVDELGEKIVHDLGGHMTDDMHECTHLITDKIRRTVKFMCAVVRGAYILNRDWLKDSKKQWRFLPEEDYELREDHNNSTSSSTSMSLEEQFNFNLHESLKIARSRSLPLFHDLRIHVMKSVLPPPNEMYQIILCGGGEVVKRMPGSDAGVIIIGVEGEKRTKKQLGVRMMSKEFILTGILQQKLDHQKFLLNQDDITTSTSYNNSCGTRATRGARAKKTLIK
ncbi:uncharacterized protein LOC101243469 [Ciona intestinalis]